MLYVVVCRYVKFVCDRQCLDNKCCTLNISYAFGDVVCCSFHLTAPQTLLSSHEGSSIDFMPPADLALCFSSTQFARIGARIQFQDGHAGL